MREGNFLEQPQQNQPKTPERGDFELDKKDIGDANAITDDWDQYMAKSESMPEEKLENLSVREIEEIEGELRGNQEVSEPVSESKKDFPFKWFKTEKDSIYAYDNDGKTSRFKTVEGKQYERQNVTVFVDLTPEEEAKFLENIDLMSENKLVCVAEELSSNDGARIIRDISEVHDPDKIYLAVFNLDTKMWEMKKKASLKPIMGYTPFDTRMYEEHGKPRVKAHLGHKIVEIEKAREPVAEPAAEPAKEESALESVSIPDETPAQNAETREMKVEQEVVAESAKEERKTENAPTLMEKPIESNEKREMGEIVMNKEKIRDFIDVGRKLAHAFRERDEERLNPLIEERYISLLVASFDNLHMLLRDDKQTVNGEELGRAITRIANAIQNIGNVPRGQSMRDNAESLGKVIFRLKEIEDKTHNTALSLSGEKESRPEEILKSLRKLEDAIREKWIFVARKRNALDQYQK